MRRITLFSTLAIALLASAVSANAQSRTQIGILECRGGTSVGLIVGSVTNLGCVLRAAGRPDDIYTARITKVGVDLGILVLGIVGRAQGIRRAAAASFHARRFLPWNGHGF